MKWVDLPGYLTLGRFNNEHPLWEAMDEQTGEHRILKGVDASPDAPVDPNEAAELLRAEAASLEAVHRAHAERTGETYAPDVVRSYGLYEANGFPVLVLERIKPIERFFSRKASTLDVLFGGVLLSDAIARVHKGGYYHNDVNPNNILPYHADGVDSVKLIDLGIAIERDGTTVCSAFTPGYGSPQQIAGTFDPRSDVYGLGATLYRTITGETPYDQTPFWKGFLTPNRRRQLADDIRLVSLDKTRLRHRRLPHEARTIIESMLRTRPDERPSLLAAREGLVAAVHEIDAEAAQALPPPPYAKQ